ncbi:MAG: DUF1631 family protein [Lautropia sp.]
MPVPEQFALFDRLRKSAGLRLSHAVADMLPKIADELRVPVQVALDLATERALAEASATLRESGDSRVEAAVAALDEFHFRSLQAVPATPRGRGFELVSDAELADQIVAQTLAARAREALEEAYPAYLGRLAQLTGAVPDEDTCPLGTKALAFALVAALRPYTSDPLTAERVEAALHRHAVQPMREIIAAADRRMVEAGILSTMPRIVLFPGLRKAVESAVARGARGGATVVVAAPAAVGTSVTPAQPAVAPEPAQSEARPESQSAAQAEPQAAAQPEPQSAAQPAPQPAAQPEAAAAPTAGPAPEVAAAARATVRNVEASKTLGEHPIVGSSNPRSAFRKAVLLPSVEKLEHDAIAFAHRVGQAPFSAAAREAFFAQLRTQMKDAEVGSAQLATLDLVSAMFDYATDSERMPEPAKPLLWRLQLPAVTLACLDVGYLGEEPRSVRRLVEHIAAIATAYPDELARGSELHARIQTVVRAVEVVAHAFQIRSTVLSEQVGIEYRRANYGIGQLVSKVTRERHELESNVGRRNRRDYRRRPSREREIEVSSRIEQLLDARLQGRDVPETVVEFLKSAWLRHLRTAVLRDGEESPGYQAALNVVDDLLWTIDGAGERRSRTELAQRIPTMLKVLGQGVSDIGAKTEDYRPFFDEMFLIHLRRMQRGRKPAKSAAAPAAAGSAAASAAEDPPMLVDPIAGAAPARRSAGATVPAAVEPPASAPVAARPARRDEDSIELPPAEQLPSLEPRRFGPRDATDLEASPYPELPAVPVERRRTVAPARAAEPPVLEPGQWPTLKPALLGDDEPAGSPAAGRRRDDRSERAGRTERASDRSGGAAGNDLGEAQSQSASELKLRRLIDSTSLDDAPRSPVRMDISAGELGRDLAPGQWLELISSSRKRILAKVAWINDRRSVVLLLQYPDRLILSRHVAALMDRAERRRVFRVQ